MLLNTSDMKILSLCLSLAPTHCKNNAAGLLHVTHCEIRSIGYNLFQSTQYHFSSVRLCDGNEPGCSAQMKWESNIASRDMPSICVSFFWKILNLDKCVDLDMSREQRALWVLWVHQCICVISNHFLIGWFVAAVTLWELVR